MTTASPLHILEDPAFAARLRAMDTALASGDTSDLPTLCADLPLDVFGLVCLLRPPEYPALAAYLPEMPPDALQVEWVGSSGLPLLLQSLAFVKTVRGLYERHSGRALTAATVLDYGCGWGRLMRLFARWVPEARLHGVDAWGHILEVARSLKVRGQLGAVAEYPTELPAGPEFDLVYLFSIFTHLSEKAHLAVLSAIRARLAPGGVVVATVRPVDFWRFSGAAGADHLAALHREHGLAFLPHPALKPGADGDVPYGDTSISLDYVHRRWEGFRVVEVEYNALDPYQVLVALQRT